MQCGYKVTVPNFTQVSDVLPCRQSMHFVGPQMSSATPTGDCGVSKCATGGLHEVGCVMPYENWPTLGI